MKEVRECPHCFSEIDARATVCPQCRRDIAPATAEPAAADARPNVAVEALTKGGGGLTAKQFLFFVVVGVILFVMVTSPGRGRSQQPATVDCGQVAASHKNRAEALMVDYLVAHRGGDAAEKARIRDRAAAISWPSCAAAARLAMGDWFNAVDDDSQSRMTSADTRFLQVFR